MTVKRIAKVGKWVLLAVLLAVVATAGAAYYLTTSQSSSAARAAERHENTASDDVRVEVMCPLKGVMPRTTTQPGSVQSFEAADLYAGASGYLGRVDSRGQAGAPPAAASSTGGEDIGEVDIGDRVTKGEVLAQVDVPDLVKQVQQQKAALEAAQASVAQMQASVASAKADVEAARGGGRRGLTRPSTALMPRRFSAASSSNACMTSSMLKAARSSTSASWTNTKMIATRPLPPRARLAPNWPRRTMA